LEKEMGAAEEKEERAWKRKWMHLRNMRGFRRGEGTSEEKEERGLKEEMYATEEKEEGV
jgi:hypothetical protein